MKSSSIPATTWRSALTPALLAMAFAGLLAQPPFSRAVAGSGTAGAAEAPASTNSRAVVVQRHGRGLRGTIEHIPFVLLRGTDAARGEAYGALCGPDVIKLLDQVLAPYLNKERPDAWQALVRTVERDFVFPDEMLVQMEAFIRGVRESMARDQRFMTSLGRELGVSDLKALQALADLMSSGRIKFGGCSSFSAWGDLTPGGGVITGRNLDYTTFPGRLPMMLIAQEPEEAGRMRTIEVSIAGIFGASTALNEEGVLMMLHDEPGLPSSFRKGWVPRVAALRQAIEKVRASSAVEDVAGALRRSPVVMGGNVHISFPADAQRAAGPAVIEWDGNDATGGVTIRKPRASEPLTAIFCTNHYLDRASRSSSGSMSRYNELLGSTQRRVAQKGAVELSTAKEMMHRVAVRGDSSTYLSVIAFPAHRQMHIALSARPGDAATESQWVEVNWADVFKE